MSKALETDNKFVEALESALKTEFGETYTIISNPRFDPSVEVHGSPDLVVKDPTGKMTLIEVKVTPPDDDLPFATVPQMRRLKDENRDISANVVLVSTSYVSEAVERSLKFHEIGVITGRSHGEIVPKLRSMIAMSPLEI
jgi:hypothetical protein